MGWQNGVSPVFLGIPVIQSMVNKKGDQLLIKSWLIKHVDFHSMLSFQVWRALQPSSTRYTDCDSQTVFFFFVAHLGQTKLHCTGWKVSSYISIKKIKTHKTSEENKPQIQIYPRPYTTTSHIKNLSTSCFLKPRKSKPNFPTTSLGGHTGASGNTWILAMEKHRWSV